jgi:hypothetical protein
MSKEVVLLSALIVGVVLLFIPVALAVVGHDAPAIRPGQFATGNYVFPQNVSVTGNVGIGTTSPATQFEVYKDNGVGIVDGAFRVGFSGTNLNRVLLINDTNGVISLQTRAIDDNSVQSLLINPAGGNVGIGTANPTMTFVINSSNNNAMIIRHTSTTGTPILYIGNSDLSHYGLLSVYGGVSLPFTGALTGATCIGAASNNALQFAANNDVKMTIAAGGKVGIGLTNPDTALQVNGVIANNGWSTFANGDTTPSVSGNNIFTTSNSGPTTITNFDDGINGQIITIYCGDAQTTITRANAVLDGGTNFVCTLYDTITLIKSTYWTEIARSVNS